MAKYCLTRYLFITGQGIVFGKVINTSGYYLPPSDRIIHNKVTEIHSFD